MVTNVERVLEWRKRNRGRYNEYMRRYMLERRRRVLGVVEPEKVVVGAVVGVVNGGVDGEVKGG